LKQAGVTAEKVRLVDRVVLGNGHMMFMKTNSEEIVGDRGVVGQSGVKEMTTLVISQTRLNFTRK
jgi:hypothetical protein